MLPESLPQCPHRWVDSSKLLGKIHAKRDISHEGPIKTQICAWSFRGGIKSAVLTGLNEPCRVRNWLVMNSLHPQQLWCSFTRRSRKVLYSVFCIYNTAAFAVFWPQPYGRSDCWWSIPPDTPQSHSTPTPKRRKAFQMHPNACLCGLSMVVKQSANKPLLIPVKCVLVSNNSNCAESWRPAVEHKHNGCLIIYSYCLESETMLCKHYSFENSANFRLCDACLHNNSKQNWHQWTDTISRPHKEAEFGRLNQVISWALNIKPSIIVHSVRAECYFNIHLVAGDLHRHRQLIYLIWILTCFGTNTAVPVQILEAITWMTTNEKW